ncbi:MAG: hypothetical protein WC719_00580 [Patescibacteria group bacterium]|jgi:hypothetical protein
MEMKGIGGGKDFSVVKFKDKLGFATKYNSLKDKRESIMKVVRNSEGAIRGSRFKASAAISKLKSLDKNISAEELRSVRKAFQQLETAPKPRISSLQKAIVAAEEKKAAATSTLKLVRPSLSKTNRDPSFYGNVDTYKQHGTGLASGSISAGGHYGVAANRGETYDKGLDNKKPSNPIGHQRVNL